MVYCLHWHAAGVTKSFHQHILTDHVAHIKESVLPYYYQAILLKVFNTYTVTLLYPCGWLGEDTNVTK